MSKIIYIMIISAIPLVEQRGAIPVGIFTGCDPFIVFIASYIGSLIPVPFIFYLFNWIMDLLRNHHWLPWFVNLVDNKIAKNTTRFEKYKEPALITFIGIPLPTTGVWTGTAVATFLKLDFKKTMICAMIGAFISAVVITAVCVFLPALAQSIF
ncbi:MAG: small multi-drug export protein [Erysipelotrichaceae bacterium]|nr:small multi-drug export protein [Erysipelotrichaceae bacterium]